ncbi:sporulation protein [Pontibacillus halophilus JSM 076056 = DSM 19796]|uniref:Sporulation protein n=1 Tax=Pontibacillus halophilus JSM 076056 = DSM 19796 TaxID=1385510 RepID=A0A0A5GLN3_9BACI|nr:CAP domain-containing protein [Pontibacillus halophilus]KGX92045.1 sporulation protein [Pontibacillus halophilus JSM 076056 = DSM 19796]
MNPIVKYSLTAVLSLSMLAACTNEEGMDRNRNTMDNNVNEVGYGGNNNGQNIDLPGNMEDYNVRTEMRRYEIPMDEFGQSGQFDRNGQTRQEQPNRNQNEQQYNQAPSNNQKGNGNAQQDSGKTEQQQDEEDSKNQASVKDQVIKLTNEERKKNGLSALKEDTELQKVAQKKSEDMVNNDYFSHTSPTYGSPFEMMDQFGIDYRTAAENIAAGQQTAEEVVRGWMNSEGHRKNILNSKVTHIGIGVEKDAQDGKFWTQMFIQK